MADAESDPLLKPALLDPCSGTQALARQARSGSDEGLTGLYRRLAPALHAWACLRIRPGLRGRLDPEDIVQEVWWRALAAFRDFDPARGTFRAWLFTIATRVLLNAFRQLAARGEGAAPGPRNVALPDGLPDDGTAISRQVARDEALHSLIDRVRALDEEDRTLFVHCGLEGLGPTEVAPMIGIGSEAAMKRWQRLRRTLREDLQAGDLFDD